MVPSDGLVFTPVTKPPNERDGVLHGLLDAVGVQVMVASSEPMVPLEFAGVLQPDIVDVDVDLHALGVANLVARGLDRDVGVVPGDVLHQERRHDAERHDGLVLHHALDGLGHDLFARLRAYSSPPSSAAHTSATTMTSDQDDRQRIAEEARLIFTGASEPVAEVSASGRADVLGGASGGGPAAGCAGRDCLRGVGDLLGGGIGRDRGRLTGSPG